MDQSQQDAAPKHLAVQIAHHAVWEANRAPHGCVLPHSSAMHRISTACSKVPLLQSLERRDLGFMVPRQAKSPGAFTQGENEREGASEGMECCPSAAGSSQAGRYRKLTVRTLKRQRSVRPGGASQ
eukprot:s2095_g6.t1